MGLLRTVMDVYMHIFDADHSIRPILYFVIRDYSGATPIDNLSAVLKDDLRDLFSTIKKPHLAQSVNFENLFELHFEFLPHKILQNNLFFSAIENLRSKFEKLILERNDVAAVSYSDFPLLSQNIWHKITENKDLNLPTEREVLARFRCDEISSVASVENV